MCSCLTHSLTLTLSFSSLTLCTRSFYCELDYAANYVPLWGSRLKLAISEAADLGGISESISHYTWKVAYWLDAKMPAGSSLSPASPLHFQLSFPAAHPTDQQHCWAHHQMLCCKLEVLAPKSQHSSIQWFPSTTSNWMCWAPRFNHEWEAEDCSPFS